MKVNLVLILVLGASLCATCQQNKTTIPANTTPVIESTATPQTDPDIEEYNVYNDLLASQFSGDDIDQVLIIDHTQVNPPNLLEQDLSAFQENTVLTPALITSFMERNQQSHSLEPVFDFELEYQLWTEEDVNELRSLDEASGWKLFYEKYPNTYGFIYLSRVGFNFDFSQALIYMSSYHYEQPIQGNYYLMVKIDGHWVIEASYGWNS